MQLTVDVQVHGLALPDFFQGCGTAFTRLNHCVTGGGINAAEALEDALDQVAMVGETPDEVCEALEAAGKEAVTGVTEEAGADDDRMFYLSLRW